MDTITQFAGFLTVALILTIACVSVKWHAVKFLGRAWRFPLPQGVQTPNPWAVFFSLLFVVSYFISNLWQISPWFFENPEAYGFALRLKTLAEQIRQVIYLGLVFLLLTKSSLPSPDLHAKLVLLILLMAEGFAILEYAQCKVLVDPIGKQDLVLSQEWGITKSKYACGRISALSPYIAPVITSIWLLVIWMWRSIRGHDRQDRRQNSS